MRIVRWLGIFLMLGWAEAYAQGEAYRNAQLLIETQELAGILSNPELRLVDARPSGEYSRVHLPGAVNLPAPATDDLEANHQGFPLFPDRAQQLFRMAGINAASRVVLYDDQGSRFATRVFYVLEFFGHARVQVLNGGFRKWQCEGRPTTTDVPPVAPGDFTPAPNPSRIATAQWLSAHLKDPAVKVVDARSPAEYRGGHIPGAVNIEWTQTLEPGAIKTFLPSRQLEELFAESQVARDLEVVSYCQMAVRGAEIYFVLRLLGYERVRLYDGSWEDWSADQTLPVEK